LDINIYGIQAYGLVDLHPINIENHHLSEEYVRLIKKIQPQGPYLISGWCIGGVIAFEMARQLEQAGEKLKALIMFDSETYGVNKYRFTLDSETNYINSLLENQKCAVNQIESTVESSWRSATDVLDIKGKVEPCIIDKIDKAIVDAMPENAYNSATEFICHLNTIRTLSRLRDVYEPSQRIEANAYFINPTDGRGVYPERWNPFLKKGVNVVNVDGDHFSMFKKPNVVTLSNELKKILSDEIS